MLPAGDVVVRVGVTVAVLVGMAAWVIRYLLYAYGAPEQVIWMVQGRDVRHAGKLA